MGTARPRTGASGSRSRAWGLRLASVLAAVLLLPGLAQAHTVRGYTVGDGPGTPEASAIEGEYIRFRIARTSNSIHVTHPVSRWYWTLDFDGTATADDIHSDSPTSGVKILDTTAYKDRELETYIDIKTVDDGKVTGNKTFTFKLTKFEHTRHSPDGLGSPRTIDATIYDDDTARVTIGDAAADEGDAITFTVSVDNAVDGGFTVTPTYGSGSTGSDDFTANTTPIQFTGTAGESHTFTVQTTEDTLGEGWEYFEVRPVVSGSSIPRSHLAGVGVARGTIHDDDETQTIIRILNADALEGDQIEFTVYSNDYLLDPDCGAVRIVPSYTNGTAESADYTENTTQPHVPGRRQRDADLPRQHRRGRGARGRRDVPGHAHA